jgi:hypothetical protein
MKIETEIWESNIAPDPNGYGALQHDKPARTGYFSWTKYEAGLEPGWERIGRADLPGALYSWVRGLCPRPRARYYNRAIEGKWHYIVAWRGVEIIRW